MRKDQTNSAVLPLQIFFDDSVRNIQAGKNVGLHTVLVSPLLTLSMLGLLLCFWQRDFINAKTQLEIENRKSKKA